MDLKNITINQTIRPIKIGFLVDPKRINSIKDAIVYNSYLRGGIHNIIIPIWNKKTEKRQKIHYIGLVETCKPDFIVNLTKKNVPSEITNQYKPEYIISKESFVKEKDKEPLFLLGLKNYLNLNKLLNEIKEDNLFGSKKASFVYPEISFSSENILLGFLLGSYKNNRFQKIYNDSCSPQIIKNIKDMKGEYLSYLSPINTTGRNLKQWGNIGALGSFVAYFGKSDSLYDLIEFWNIRCTGRNILYVPIEYLDLFKKPFNQFVEAGNYKINDTIDNWTSCVKGFSISEKELKASIEKILNENNNGKVCIQNRIPGWSQSGHKRVMKQINMPEFYEYKKEIDLVSDGKTISSFKIHSPSFINEDRANIDLMKKYRAVGIQPSGFFGEGKTIFLPFDESLEKIATNKLFFGSSDSIRFNQSGITIFENGFNHSYHIHPIEIEQVFKEYFGFYGYDIEYSNAGIIAKKIIEHMGGYIDNCRIFKIQNVRNLLRELSTVLGDNEDKKKKSKEKIRKGMDASTITQKFKEQEFDKFNIMPLLNFYNKNSESNKEKVMLDHLFNKGILHPGLNFRCDNCLKEDWYSIKDFSNQFKCKYCFKEQKVQLVNYTGQDNRWHYKPDGLFSLADGGQGSIAVIVTLHRLSHFSRMGTNFNYITSINLINKTDPKKKFECDFVGIINSQEGNNCELIIGEVKNYSSLTKKDFDKLLRLGNCLSKKPILCFSILREEYTEYEKKKIMQFVKKKFIVLPFTRHELDPYELFDRFNDTKYKYANTYEELSENLIKLNIDSNYFRPF